MRDINRIYPFCMKLAEVWQTHPDWRFGQLVVNVLGVDPFYIEDDEALDKFIKYFFEKDLTDEA